MERATKSAGNELENQSGIRMPPLLIRSLTLPVLKNEGHARLLEESGLFQTHQQMQVDWEMIMMRPFSRMPPLYSNHRQDLVNWLKFAWGAAFWHLRADRESFNLSMVQ